MSGLKSDNMNRTNMKTLKTLPRALFVTGLTIATLGLLAPALSMADGKGALKLMFGPQPQAQVQPASSGKATMSCPRCTDGYKKVADTSVRGLRADSTRTAAAHMCPACSTKITSVGAGKAKTDKVSHSCGMETSCCVAAK
jgi:hypothetical protein